MRTRAHKYGAKPKTVDGIRFASTREATRYQELRLLERAGEIYGLEVQPKYPLYVNQKAIAVYIADFRYRTKRGREVVEDIKSRPTMTPLYRLKKKIFEANYGISITEVM